LSHTHTVTQTHTHSFNSFTLLLPSTSIPFFISLLSLPLSLSHSPSSQFSIPLINYNYRYFLLHFHFIALLDLFFYPNNDPFFFDLFFVLHCSDLNSVTPLWCFSVLDRFSISMELAVNWGCKGFGGSF